MKQPVDHIARPALPWRSGPGVTECGYDASKVTTLSRDAYVQRVKDFGRQRAAMVTCMTCANTAERWGTWEQDPRKALGREIEWEAGWSRRKNGTRLLDELLAIEALIAAHRDEFDAKVSEIGKRREWNQQKTAREASIRNSIK